MPKKLVSMKVYENDLIEFQQLAERIKHDAKKQVSLPVLFSGAVLVLDGVWFNNKEASSKKLNS